MIRSHNFDARLKKLEARRGAGDAVLSMPGGGGVALRVRDPLALLLAAMRAEYFAMTGDEDPSGPSRYSSQLALLGRADCCTGATVVALAHDVLTHHTEGETI